MSGVQKFTARLSEKQVFNEKFQRHRWELVEPSRLEFQSGQYVLLTVPTIPQKKSYSIASPASMNSALELLIDIAPGGPASHYLDGLQPGDSVEFMAPVGQFVIKDAGEEAFVFIATGSGIAPMKGMIEDLLIDRGDQRPIYLYWGLRHAHEQFWYDDFAMLSQQHANFTFHPVLSQAPDNWTLCRGRVTDCLSVHTMPANAGYYLCGSTAMIVDVTKILTEKGITPDHIHHEKFH